MDLTPLIGLPYDEGRQDCYSLLRRYYKMRYDMLLPNFARPGDFAYAGLDLMNLYFYGEGFRIVDTSLNNLEEGDALMIRVGMRCPTVNHFAVHTGSGMILHHLHDGQSVHEPLTVKWKQRVMTVLRHPDITEANRRTVTPANFLDLLPPHVKHRYDIPTA